MTVIKKIKADYSIIGQINNTPSSKPVLISGPLVSSAIATG